MAAALRTTMDRGEALAVAVDPDETYVGDARIREELLFSGEKSDWLGGNVPAIRELYWQNVFSLHRFRKLYKPAYADTESMPFFPSWHLRQTTDADRLGINPRVITPELYIPLPPDGHVIPIERIAHIGSSLMERTFSRIDLLLRGYDGSSDQT